MTLNEIIMSFEMGLIYGIVAIGIYLTFRIIDFPDLTCDGSFVLGAAVSSILIIGEINPLISLIAATFAGAIAGAITGILYAKFKVTNLLAGILVSFMLYSINLRIMGGIPNISLINNDTILTYISIVKLVIIGLSICAFVTFLLLTDFGLALRLIGQNKRLAQSSGVNVCTLTIFGLAISNAIIALSGALFSQQQGFADVGSGIGTIIVALASVMVGEKIMPFKPIIAQVISCLIGSIIYRLFISLALHSDCLGFTTSDLNLITGLMLITIMYASKKQGGSYVSP